MATKKQKRLALEARRAEREAQRREDGLRAQQKDQEIRAAKKERAASDAERRNRRQRTAMAMNNVRGTT